MKSILTLLATVLILLITLAGGGAFLFFYLNAPPEEAPVNPVSITVEKGSSVARVATELQDQGIIRSPRLLILYSRVRNTHLLLKAGEYSIAPRSSMIEIHDQLIVGRQELKKITIPEGWTAAAIGTLLDSSGICGAESFAHSIKDREWLDAHEIAADSAEGYLFPDTYYFQENYPADKVAGVMVARFFEVLGNLDPDWEMLGAELVYRKIILASIVEEEYRREEEAPIIASVFQNRLEINMPLQSCATIGYIITEIQGKPHPERIWETDLRIDSPYNTYIYYGLPPGPIANPGLTALSAAWNPADTDYLFFVVKDAAAGSHTFSRTHSQHVSAKNLYLKSN